MKYFLTISVLFLLGLSEYANPKISSLPNFYAQKNNDILDTLERLCKLLSGDWALVGHRKNGIWKNPDTLVFGFGRDKKERIIENFDILTDSGLIYVEMNQKGRKILKIEKKPVLQLLKLQFDRPQKGYWQYLHDYDSVTNICTPESCQPVPSLVKKDDNFYIHLVGLVGESEIKIHFISEKKLILGDEDNNTVYRKFVEKSE